MYGFLDDQLLRPHTRLSRLTSYLTIFGAKTKKREIFSDYFSIYHHWKSFNGAFLSGGAHESFKKSYFSIKAIPRQIDCIIRRFSFLPLDIAREGLERRLLEVNKFLRFIAIARKRQLEARRK